jgi:hypothetical protein
MARGRAGAAGTALDGITTETGSVQLRRAIGARAFAQARTAWFADDDRPGPTERVVPGYTLVDLSGGATIGRHLEIRGLIRNLFDQQYFASQDVRAIFAPARAAPHRRRPLLICTAPRGMTPRSVRFRSAVTGADTGQRPVAGPVSITGGPAVSAALVSAAPTEPSAHLLRAAPRRLVAAAITLAVSAELGVTYFREAQLDAVRSELAQRGVAAALVDADRHDAVARPELEGSPEHLRVLAPLVRFHQATHDVIYVYTLMLCDGKPYFGIDSAYRYKVPGDTEPHDPPMTPYPAPIRTSCARSRKAPSG